MASARNKTRTLRQSFDEYEIPVSELLTAAGVSAQDIALGGTWRVRIIGDTAKLIRNNAPELNPSGQLARNEPT